MILLTISLLMTNPAPLDMPRADAFLVEEDGVRRLEDRYNRMDLWVSQATVGRWADEERVFVLAKLDREPPALAADGVLTREDFAGECVPMRRIRANGKPPAAFRRAIEILADCPLAEEKPRSARQLPRGYRDVDYWQNPTNYADIVCAFRPEKSEAWYLAVWHLADTDDYAERMQVFEDQFLRREFPAFQSSHPSQPPQPTHPSQPFSERELLRSDVRHSVAAYSNWHFSDSEEFCVIDDLPTRAFVSALTNEFAAMRARYAETVSTAIDGSNVLCVARLYGSRAEYLEALEVEGCTNMAWSAAYWSPLRRELVAYLPENGEQELLKTVRHEAFHQYLSYAASMIPVSPWLNEGYAQYFEDEGLESWGGLEGLGVKGDEDIDKIAAAIPSVLLMDYEQFYGGSDFERRFKYQLAWSVVRFIEKGADEVRLKPFEGLKTRYMDALVETRDMRKATSAAFKDADLLKTFIAEWKKFWKKG